MSNKFDIIKKGYRTLLEERNDLIKFDNRNSNFKELKKHSIELQHLITRLNSKKREFLKEYLLNNNTAAQKFFIASDNIIQSTLTDYLNPINEKISEKRDKRLFLFGILFGFILSALYQPIYDYCFSDKVNPPEINKEYFNTQIEKNNQKNRTLIINGFKKKINSLETKIDSLENKIINFNKVNK